MQLKEHILYGGAASIALVPVFGIKALFFFLSSVLIDMDHYIDFLYYARFRNWSVRSMFQFHGLMARWIEKPHVCALEAFHTAEFLLCLLFVSLYFHSTELLLIFSGMIFHLILDLWRLRQWGKVRVRALSFIEYWLRSRKMKKIGTSPEKIFEEAYAVISQDDKNQGNALLKTDDLPRSPLLGKERARVRISSERQPSP